MGLVVLPLAEMVAAGHGARRLPIRVRCRDCGEVGELQVRPPVPTRGPSGWMEMHRPGPWRSAREHTLISELGYPLRTLIPNQTERSENGGSMHEFRYIVGGLVGRFGIVLCLLVVPARLFGLSSLFGISTSDWFEMGVACLLIGCFELLLVRAQPR